MCCRSMRHECLQLARQYGAAFLQLYLKCPLQVVLARNAARTEAYRVPRAVITRMAEVIEEPDGSKHAWEMNTLVLDSCNLDLASHADR